MPEIQFAEEGKTVEELKEYLGKALQCLTKEEKEMLAKWVVETTDYKQQLDWNSFDKNVALVSAVPFDDILGDSIRFEFIQNGEKRIHGLRINRLLYLLEDYTKDCFIFSNEEVIEKRNGVVVSRKAYR